MADQRLQYTELLVGANHPTLTDTCNRLTLVSHETDGTHKFVLDTTDSTTSGTGAIITAGGIGVAKNANIGGALGVTGHVTLEGVTSTGATGTGKLVFATSPTLVTPNLGIVNSADFSTGTFTWPTFNQDTTGSAVYWKTSGTGKASISGPAVGTTRAYTFPDSDATILYSGGALGTPSSGTVTNLTGTASININGTVGATTANTGAFTSITSTSASGITQIQAATQDGVKLLGRAGGTGSYTATITPTTLTASRTITLPDSNTNIPIAAQTLTFSGPTAARTITLPDASFTAARTDALQTFTGVQTFSSDPILSSGTANGVLYLNGSKAVTSGTGLTFDGANLGLGVTPSGAILCLSYGTGDGIFIQNTSSAGYADIVFKDSSGNATFALGYANPSVGSGFNSSAYVSTFGSTPLAFGIGLSQKMALDASGNLLVSNLAGSGNRAVYSDASGNLTNSSSDETLKTNITDITYGLDVVNLLHPVSYNWLDTEKRGEQIEIGFVAQEVQELIPEVIGTNFDETLSLDYPKLTAVIVKAVQELSAKVAALEAR